jgi:acyl-CoA hydrolase
MHAPSHNSGCSFSTIHLLEIVLTYSSTVGASITSTSALLQSPDQGKPNGEQSSKTKNLLKKLKEENQQRKEKVQHVSHEEAERMTGYGENTGKERDEREKTVKGGSLATLLF